MHTHVSRKVVATLLLLWVSATALIAAAPPAQVVVPDEANADGSQAHSTLFTLPYIRQLCPGDVVQGEVPLRGREGLWNELQHFFDTGDTAVFDNADLYFFYGNLGEEVRIVVHPLTAQLDVALALNTGFDAAQSFFRFGDGWTGYDVEAYTALYMRDSTGIYTVAIWDSTGVAGPLQNLPYELRITGSIPPCELSVNIDIKPGDQTNSVNMNGNGVVPVAILGSADFQVSQIDIASLKFAGMDVRVRGNGTPQCAGEDVSGDGISDLVCQFVDDPTQWSPDNGTASVTGNLRPEFGGTPFRGSDTINLVQG